MARNTRFALFALGLFAGSTACGGGGGSGGGSPIPVFFELEPNDAPELANPVGPIGIGDHFRILGHVSSIGPDLFDGFALQAVEPCQVELALYADDPFADLDVCVYDPMLAAYAFCFASPFNPETGAFSIFGSGTDFHLVVSSFAGAASYELDVRVVPLSAGSFATAGSGVRLERAGAEAAAVEPARQAHLERYFRGVRAASFEAKEDELYEPGELIEVDGDGNLRRTPLRVLRPRARESREEGSPPHVKVPR